MAWCHLGTKPLPPPIMTLIPWRNIYALPGTVYSGSIQIPSHYYTPAQRSWRGGILDSPCPSVRPSVCRRHGFRSITQVCFGISISNFICMLMVAISRTLLIFSNVTFKMAALRPYWIFWFPDSNFTLALNINFKLQRHNTYVYGYESIDFQQRHFQNGRLAAILDFSVSELCRWQGFWDVSQVCFGISISNFICMLMVVIGKSLLIFSEVTFKMAAWWPY